MSALILRKSLTKISRYDVVLMDWGTILAGAAVLAPLVALLLHALGILEKMNSFIGRTWAAIFRTSGATHPSRTLVLIQQPRSNSLWWHMGNTGKKGSHQPPLPMMQVCADLNVTNIWQADITMAGAVLRYRPWWSIVWRQQLGDAHVFNGGQIITPNSMEWVRAHFMFKPPWRKAGKTLVADIGIIDHFNNRHWLRGVHFPYM